MLNAMSPIRNISDRDYLDGLYRNYSGMLHNLAFFILRDRGCAEDVVINAMLSLFSLIPKLQAMEERELVAYLRKTVRCAAYKIYKANKRRSVTELPLDSDTLFSLPDKSGDPASLLIESEDFRMVREAVAALPEKDRRVLYLKYASDLTAVEIAELTGAPSAAAVRERLSRARRRVLALLSERGWSDAGEQTDSGPAGAVGGPALSEDR